MINAKIKRFSVRPTGVGVLFVWKDLPVGQPLFFKTLADCSTATLKVKDQTVHVENVSTVDGQNYTGRIRGFEPSFVEEFEGMLIGEGIEFVESHVFGASG
jgi:hypothetical protein